MEGGCIFGQNGDLPILGHTRPVSTGRSRKWGIGLPHQDLSRQVQHGGQGGGGGGGEG